MFSDLLPFWSDNRLTFLKLQPHLLNEPFLCKEFIEQVEGIEIPPEP